MFDRKKISLFWMNKFIKIFTFLFVCFLILILFGVLIYILYSSILAFSTYG